MRKINLVKILVILEYDVKIFGMLISLIEKITMSYDMKLYIELRNIIINNYN